MNSNVIIDFVKPFYLALGNYLWLCDFIATLYLLDESEVFIFDIALLEDYWSHLMLVSKLRRL